MAEDIKEEEISEQEQNENSSDETQNEEVSDGLIPGDDEPTAKEEDSTTQEEPSSEPVVAQAESEPSPAPTQEEAESEVEEEDATPIQTKQTKIQKILMIVAGVLAGILVLGFALYLFGVFDPEEPPKPVMTPEMMDMNQTKEPEKYIFDAKDINIDRLNGKLRILTKYEIIGTEEEERQKELEKNSKLSTAQINELINAEQVEIEKKKKADEEAKKAEIERKKQEALKKEQEEKAKTERPYDLLKFIQVLANDSLLSSINTEMEKFKVKTSKCSDNSQEFFLIGPFNSNKELNQAFRTIYNNVTQSATKKDLARLEFNRICK
jgi:hypothetical protein